MALIDALQNPDLFDHPVTQFEVIETHISWVLLTGPYAYKIKKPVNFGFLDFSTLEKRQYYCQEEIRLNRRLAPQLYLDVSTIRGTEQHPHLYTDGPIIEYAVKMHQFPQQAQLDRRLAQQGLAPAHIDALAQTVARFHLQIALVPIDSPFGDLAHVTEPVLENFAQIRHCIKDQDVIARLDPLQQWTEAQLVKLGELITQRKANGFIRECHGDMHLRNMALIDNQIVIFDCIEFNKNFYLIDVMSEIAFVVMDLEDRLQPALARRFLNLYLEITGDYAGLQLLDFYKVYRAMVRAKVAALRTSQEQAGTEDYDKTYQDFLQYLQLAEGYTRPGPPVLLINHGLSASGKSVGTRMLLEQFAAIVLRSDVERKRLFAIENQQHATSQVGEGIYSQTASEKTYTHLATLAKLLLRAGLCVIIDAANLKKSQRHVFIDLANSIPCPYIIMHYQARPETLKQRLTHRLETEHDASDATLEVLDHQIDTAEALSDDELTHTVTVNTEDKLDPQTLLEKITRLQNATPGEH